MTEAKKTAAAKPRASAAKSETRSQTVEIKIGVQHTPREIVLDVDLTADQVAKELSDATEKNATLILKDVKGRRVLLPADKVAYIEIGEPEGSRRVGFGG